MKAFAALFQALDATTAQSAKLAALVAYLRVAPPADAAWATYFLAGGKPRQMVPTKRLKALAQEAAGLPEWLFEESYQAVGDLAETLALLLPPPAAPTELTLAEWMAQLLPLRALPPDEADARLRTQWHMLAPEQRFVYFKLITGNFRVGVSRLQVTQALATVSALDPKRIAHRLMGYTQIGRQPQASDYQALIAPVDDDASTTDAADAGQPYPFFLAHPFNQPVAELPALLGTPEDWLVEWKWDGIRAQIVRRGGAVWVWSRGEELVTDRFPELAQLRDFLPDGTVIDGEVLAFRDGAPLSFNALQSRIGRKTVPKKLLTEAPVVLMAYDLLEDAGADIRDRPFAERRARLAQIVAAAPAEAPLRLSPDVDFSDWAALAAARETSRDRQAEGLMLKRLDSPYLAGRKKG
ncbi:MAG: cisplatin damage response ATP-dependent DNA ligase, partial [Gammaproteobacteria bacterium]|nr:cisplatin damage response ATP-dependent DNA ligase [Gammaproteobacteria bacterium]